jgi:ArsR family transcriptional regulator, arsenate/arsenite/antimonite-responsive transcriptional repressor
MPIKPAAPVRALPATRGTRRLGLGAYAAQSLAGLAGLCEYLKELGGPIPNEQSHVGEMHEPQDHHHETDFRAQKLKRLDEIRGLGAVAQGQGDKADIDEVEADEQQMVDRIGEVFEALSSTVRRKILAYLSATDLTAGDISARFEISKPSVSKHLSILENAGLVRSERRGQFIHYSLVRDNLVNTLNGYVQEVCPVSKPLKRESKARAAGR